MMSAEVSHPTSQHTTGPGAPVHRSRFWGLPSSALGRWSLTFGILFFVFMAVFYGAVAAEAGVGADSFVEQWPLWGSIIPAALCGILAAVTGIWSLAARGERSILVILATLIGLFVAWFVSGELLFPH